MCGHNGCRLPVSRKGDRCWHHPLSNEEARALFRERFAASEREADRKHLRSVFCEVALRHGLGAPETRAALDALRSVSDPTDRAAPPAFDAALVARIKAESKEELRRSADPLLGEGEDG